MGAADNTETNAILASGLAIVGLLGVVGSLLPSDMLPSSTGVVSETATEVTVEQSAEREGAGIVEKEQSKQAESAGGPVFKPVELQSVTDADPKAPSASALEESASAATSAMVEVPAELVKAADEVLNPTHESASVSQGGMSKTLQAEESTSSEQKTLVELPSKEAEVDPDSEVPVPVQSAPVQASPTVTPPVSKPSWNQWQSRGYPYQQPQYLPPQYPPQAYPNPQWSYPQR